MDFSSYRVKFFLISSVMQSHSSQLLGDTTCASHELPTEQGPFLSPVPALWSLCHSLVWGRGTYLCLGRGVPSAPWWGFFSPPELI